MRNCCAVLPIMDLRAMTHSPAGGDGGVVFRVGGPPSLEVGTARGGGGDGVRTVGLVAIQGLNGEQQVLVLQVFDLREDGLQLGGGGVGGAHGVSEGRGVTAPPILHYPPPYGTSPWAAAAPTTAP